VWDKLLEGKNTKQADGYRPSQLAESVGRSRGDKERSVPTRIAGGLAKVYGNLASLGSITPVGVGRGALIGHIPDILKAQGDKSRAVESLQHFANMSPEDRAAAETNLGRRVSGAAVGSAADVLLNAAASTRSIPPLARFVAGKGAGHLIRKGVEAVSKPESLVGDEQAAEFLQRAGVDKSLYAGKVGMPRSKHYPGTVDPWFAGLRGKLIERHLEGAEPGTGEKILREGGIIVPREKQKTASANWTALAENFN
jgi:hypothetical protein